MSIFPQKMNDFLQKNRNEAKRLFIFLSVSALCVLLSCIYAVFSHGVSSAYMTFTFAYPLVGGLLSVTLLRKSKNPAFALFTLGVATLSTGSFVRGVFEIAGTGSKSIWVYTAAGAALLLLGTCMHFISRVASKRSA